jgi:hypothetical protein
MSENLDQNATTPEEKGTNNVQETKTSMGTTPVELNNENETVLPTDNQVSEVTSTENIAHISESIDSVESVEETSATEIETVLETPILIEEPVLEAEPLIDLAEITADHIDEIIANDSDIEISEAEKAQLAKLSKEELMVMVAKAAEIENLSDASDEFRRLRKALDIIWSKEYSEARAKFLEEGGLPEEFKHTEADKDVYHQYYKKFTEKRDAYRKQLEDEKLKNVDLKKAIIEKVKAIAEGEETANSLNQIKDLQKEWKDIRAIPAELKEELWNKYQHYLNTFYDNLSLNNELKELDRKKNLEIKIDLCKKMDELTQEPSLKKALIFHKKYWEDWKNTGPVPNEYREELWSRFKEAADKVFNAKMEELKAMDVVRQENLDKKVALCERADEFAKFESAQAKEWIAKVPEVQALFEEWKLIGMVSIKYQEEIWERFKKAVNTFYSNKNDFFKNLDKKRQENLRKKTELCEKAEAIMNSEDWGNTTKELIKLQEEYKTCGPVPENMQEKLWQRFRKACDVFFENKNTHFAGLVQDQNKNLEAKIELLVKFEELAASESNEDLSTKVKNLQDEWNTYGFVPFKKKDEIGKKFKDVLDKIYQRIRKDFQQNNSNRTKNHYEVIARQNDGKNILYGEEKKLSERINTLKKDIDTLQNNVGFFANSKSANQLLASVNENIAANQRKIQQLQDQLRVLRDVRTGKAPEVKKQTPVEAAPEITAADDNQTEA